MSQIKYYIYKKSKYTLSRYYYKKTDEKKFSYFTDKYHYENKLNKFIHYLKKIFLKKIILIHIIDIKIIVIINMLYLIFH